MIYQLSTASHDLVLSRHFIETACEPALHSALVEHLRERGIQVRKAADTNSDQHIPVLPVHAKFYAFVVLRHHKYSATRLSKAQSLDASLVRVRFLDIDSDSNGTWTWCGVIEDLVELTHQGQTAVLAHMRWLVPWEGVILDDRDIE